MSLKKCWGGGLQGNVLKHLRWAESSTDRYHSLSHCTLPVGAGIVLQVTERLRMRPTRNLRPRIPWFSPLPGFPAQLCLLISNYLISRPELGAGCHHTKTLSFSGESPLSAKTWVLGREDNTLPISSVAALAEACIVEEAEPQITPRLPLGRGWFW